MTSKKPRRGRGEGSIFYREDRKVWIAQIKLPDRKFRTRSAKTRVEARRKMQEMWRELEQEAQLKGPKQTVKDYLNYWLEEVYKSKLRITSYALYRRHVDNHLIPGLGHIQLQSLTVDHVQAFYLEKLQKGLKPSTVRLFHAILNDALRDAVRSKRLATNVCSVVNLPRLIRHEIEPLSKEQAQQLLEAAKEHRLLCLLTLALATGMREGELLALHWQEIDLGKRVLQVRHTVDYIYHYGIVTGEPKTESGRRSIALPQFAVDELRRHRERQLQVREKAGEKWEEHGLVFTNRNGRYVSRTYLRILFKKLLKKAGLPDIRFHDLRHSAATILLSMGVPAKVVQEILGHSNISITLNIYAHVLPGMQEEAMGKMDDWFGNDDEEETSSPL